MYLRGRVGAKVWLAVAASGLLGGCGKSSKPMPTDPNMQKPGEDCSGQTCPNLAPPTDWKGAAPSFAAHLQVVDPSGAPVAGATVRTDRIMWMTDATGFARIGPIPAHKPQPLTVEKAGWTPRFALTNVFESGQQLAHVVLTPVGVKETVALGERVLVSHEGAMVDLPPKSLIGPDGLRSSTGKAEMTQLSPDKVAPGALPASRVAFNEAGARTVMDDLLSVTYVHFTNDAGQELRLAPGQTAILEVPVPKGTDVNMGDTVAMWTLHESDNTWHQEKTCTIEARQVGGATETVCRGVVSHFSIWAIAKEYDIFAPNSLGCINANVKEEEGACYTTAIEHEVLLGCNAQGESCRPMGSFNDGFYLQEKATQVSYCSVVRPGTYRVALTYRVDASGCEGPDAPLSGRRVKVSDPLDLRSFAGMLGQTLMLNFTLNGTRDCPTLCAQVELKVDKAALAAPAWIDQDGDGAWVTMSQAEKPPLGADVDCDDTNRLIRPGAPEPFCATKDLNCDKVIPQEVKLHTEVDAYTWNTQCRSCLAVEGSKLVKPTAEVDGNHYDENCDGRVGDRDLDGFSSPQDCNDWDAKTAPNKDEIPGNRADENCDQIVVDGDNDGFPSRVHSYAAAEIMAKFPQFTVDKFVDCDDYDKATHPSIPVSQEAGQMSRFYYTADGMVHRRAGYCVMFNQDGTPSDQFFQVVKDRNCDGKLTDIDGDGFSHPVDQTLGKDKALDCDELDPRIGAGHWDPGQENVLVCELDRNKLINDSVCNVSIQPYQVGISCPVLSLSGTTVKTVCEEIKNADGSSTGDGVCAFAGWSDTNPLNIHPGELYGPCDGQKGDSNAKLPCAEGLDCGGPAEGNPWTSAFESYISNTYLEGQAVGFKGMCFPRCLIQ
jgi:hypothetical protein